MQPRYRLGAGVRQLLAAVGEQPQRHQLILARERPQRRSAGRDHRDGVRISGISLAALPGGEHPGPGRQLRWHIHHGLAVSDQPLRDMPPDALAANVRVTTGIVTYAWGERGGLAAGARGWRRMAWWSARVVRGVPRVEVPGVWPVGV